MERKHSQLILAPSTFETVKHPDLDFKNLLVQFLFVLSSSQYFSLSPHSFFFKKRYGFFSTTIFPMLCVLLPHHYCFAAFNISSVHNHSLISHNLTNYTIQPATLQIKMNTEHENLQQKPTKRKKNPPSLISPVGTYTHASCLFR